MKEYLYRITPTRLGMVKEGPTEQEARIVSEHFNYLTELLADGTLILAGRTLTVDEQTFGILIFRAGDEDAARAILEGDPAVRQGVMRAALFPYRVALLAEKASPVDNV